ncbi:MAG: hypothetical protein VXW15_15620 [Bdellovibrionota bacterium]|nr:hypothetical protein [Bdellovibrionota bacterium]
MAIILSLIAFKAQAGIFIAPEIIYTFNGSTEPSYTSAGLGKASLKNKVSGYVGSLKLGFSTSGFAMGVGYARQYSKSENETCPGNLWSSLCSSNNQTRWINYVGGFVGYQIIDSLSLVLAYSVPYGIKKDTGMDNLTIGVGLTILPFMSLVLRYSIPLNARYYDNSGKAHDLPYEISSGLDLDKVEGSAAAVGLEFPIGF